MVANVNGWRDAGLAWTTMLDVAKILRPEVSAAFVPTA